MDVVVSLLSAVQPLQDCDAADRLSYVYTAVLCVVFGLFVSGWSFVGQPIQCWFPKYFTGKKRVIYFFIDGHLKMFQDTGHSMRSTIASFRTPTSCLCLRRLSTTAMISLGILSTFRAISPSANNA